MMEFAAVLLEFRALRSDELERWIGNDWVRPQGGPGQYRFDEIDVARVGLILELRDSLEIGEPGLPAVLSLVDQIYDLRRRMMGLNAALEQTMPAPMRAALLRCLENQ
jgi:chaperone modulatory protein CbpM